MSNTSKKSLRHSIYVSLLATLSACGGGEGGGANSNSSSGVSALTLPSSSTYSVSRQKNSYAYYKQQVQTGANIAHANGATGRGQKIIISEPAGADQYSQSAFKNDVIEYGSGNKNRLLKGYSTKKSESDLEYLANNNTATKHGSMVSSLAIGSRYGIAPQASVVPFTFGGGLIKNLSDLLEKGISVKAVAISNSWGIEENTDTDNPLTGFKAPFIKALQALNSVKTDADRKNKDIPIFVWASGNMNNVEIQSNDDIKAYTISPESQFPESIKSQFKSASYKPSDFWLAAVNINADTDQLAKSSAKCGIVQKYCIGAYGGNTVTNSSYDPGAGKKNGSGTSAAAPQIAGGLAVIKSAFPSKLNSWVQKRMLKTAKHTTKDGTKLKDKDGNAVTSTNGYSDIFGAGIMRLDLATAATSKTFSVKSGGNIKGASLVLEENTKIIPHSMFGDGISNSLSKMHSYVFDNDNAEFKRNLGNYVASSNRDSLDKHINYQPLNIYSHSEYIRASYAYQATSLTSTNFVNKIQHLPFTKSNDIAFSMNNVYASFSQDGARQNIEMMLPQHKSFQYGVGFLNESGYMLGTKFLGMFNEALNSKTAYMIAKIPFKHNGWNISATSIQAFTTVDGLNGIISSKSDIYSTAYSLQATKKFKTGEFGISLSQPLRVERSIMQAHYVSGINSANDLTYKTDRFDASPSGREKTIEAFFMFNQSAKSALTYRMFYANDAGHTKGAKDYGVTMQYILKF